jgi:hypothetical protein
VVSASGRFSLTQPKLVGRGVTAQRFAQGASEPESEDWLLQRELGELDSFPFIRHSYFLGDCSLLVTDPVGPNLDVIYRSLALLGTPVSVRTTMRGLHQCLHGLTDAHSQLISHGNILPEALRISNESLPSVYLTGWSAASSNRRGAQTNGTYLTSNPCQG